MKRNYYPIYLKPALSLLAFLILSTSYGQEICDNRIDDDGDGLIDCLDPDCNDHESCWQCVTEFYQVHSNNTLVSLDPAQGTYTTLGSITGADQINGAQFNHLDGHVYAPSKINDVYKLGRLHSDGSVHDTGLALNSNGIFYVGAIDGNGKMYLSNGSGIHAVDLMQPTLTLVNLGVPHPGVADFSLDITNGLFYGIKGNSNDLKVFNPNTLSVTTYDLAGSINNESGAFGAAWSCVDGSFFAYNNFSGKIFSVDVNNLVATEILNGTGNLSINDGFNCVLSPPPFESNCGDGIDEDGDGLIDCNDPDCYASNQCTVEICNNGIDDDNDGWTDCSDSECFSLGICLEICDNGIDDNGNGLIDGQDPQCGSTGGVNGGLESNRRLSEKIVLNNFKTKVKNNQRYKEKLAGLVPFEINQKNPFNLKSFIPTAYGDTYVAESTPLNLIDITNASETAAADYYDKNLRIGSVLAIHSDEGVYEHTKYICDRLAGSQLLDVSYLNIRGYNLISYELLNAQGQKEYALSFSAYHEENEGFHLESFWNLHRYTENQDFYNFQIWTSSYETVIELAERLIDNVTVTAPISTNSYGALPQVFAMHGNYQNAQLRLVIKNKDQSKKLYFKGNFRSVEGGNIENLEIEIPLSGAAQEIVNIDTDFIYDLGASIATVNNIDDEIFVADGAWGVDNFNPNAEVLDFTVTKEEHPRKLGIYRLERAISIEAKVKDYLNIFRSLDAKTTALDLSDLNALNFSAAGTGVLEITLVKSSIEAWEEQYRSYVDLDGTKQIYQLGLEDFSAPNQAALSLEDINMIVFTLVGNGLDFEAKELSLEDLYFFNQDLQAFSTTAQNLLSISPNPVVKLTSINWASPKLGLYKLIVYNALGKEVYRTAILKEGLSLDTELDLSALSAGIYYISLQQGQEKISQSKFVKI